MFVQTRRRLLASTFIIAAAIHAPAYAQTQDVPEPSGTTTADDPAVQIEETPGSDEIVVTGSLITNPNLEQSTPVNVTTSDTIELNQSNVAEEVLRETPGIVPSIGSAVNNGNPGFSTVNLRGLGVSRNIVLLDGFRITPANLLGVVDLNNIPLALIERVDALTGAAVTTYGADAITGVVNFITKRDFAGFELVGSEQITERGDGNTMRIDATVGANFDDGRGNAVLSLGYQEADAIFQGQRDISLNTLDSYSNTFLGSGTSVPSRFSGTRPIDPLTGQPSVNPATANGGLRQINPATGQAVGTFATFNFNPFNIFQTPFERFNIFGQANYEVSDAIEVNARGLFSKNNVSTIVAPSGSFGALITINLNNPFLPAPLRRQFCAFDTNPAAAIYTPRIDPASCEAAAQATGPGDPRYRTIDATLNRRSVEAGPRTSDFQTTIFDYRVGVGGGLTDSLDWDVTGSYGESENIQTLGGFVLTSRLRQGVRVGGTLANPVCENTANDCVPVNIFGDAGTISQAAADYLTEASTTTNRTSLAQGRGTISGDLGFTLPTAANPIGVAVGGEYRRYQAQQQSDTLAQSPGELGGAGGAAPNIDGGYDVYEAFGEIIAPLIEDRPFFESLTLEAGLRYSDYTIDAPGNPGFDTWTYKAGGSWEPGYGLKLRGNYSRAVRAPNIGELFTPESVALTNLAIDPCSGSAPTTNVNLRAVCIAQGAPAGTIGSINNPTAAQANIVVRGGTYLVPEKADTYTIGAVFQPDFLSGFNLSVDYYNIKIKGAIGAATPGDLIDACFGNLTASSVTNPDCTIIRRNPTTGALDGDPASTPGLFGPLSNQGRLFTDGIDLIANYRSDLGFLGDAGLALSFVGNWTNSSRFQSKPGGLDRECVGYYSVNCSFTGSIQPEFQFSQRTTLSFDDVDVSLLWRWIDDVAFEPQQLADDTVVAIATGCTDPTGADPDGCLVDPEFRQIGSRSYFDLATRFNANENLTFTFTVQNLLDKDPPLVGNTIGATTFNSGNTYPSTYDALGRRFAASVKLTF